MPCYNPLQAYFVELEDGTRDVKFSNDAARCFREGLRYEGFEEIFQLPCGRCMGCRLERSRQWAVRIMHEASLYDDNCFITLTYADEFLPKDGSLDKSHFQLFMKRLRRKYVSTLPKGLSQEEEEAWLLKHGIRFYHCGEYGESLSRPHYHAILFNFDFPDKKFWKVHNEEKMYVSESLSSLWTYGHSAIGSVSFESAAYVARYCTKLVTGSVADEHYQGRLPEYSTMSRRPGIGRGWYDRFRRDVFPCDNVVMNGVFMKPPRYYDNLFSEDFPEDFERVRVDRVDRASSRSRDSSYRRLKDREACQLARSKQLKRQLEI